MAWHTPSLLWSTTLLATILARLLSSSITSLQQPPTISIMVSGHCQYTSRQLSYIQHHSRIMSLPLQLTMFFTINQLDTMLSTINQLDTI